MHTPPGAGARPATLAGLLLACAALWCQAAQPAGTGIGAVLPPERNNMGAAAAPVAKASEAKASPARPSAIAPQGDIGATANPPRASKRERSGTGR